MAELLDWALSLSTYDVLFAFAAAGLLVNALVMFGIQGRINRLVDDLRNRGVL